MPQEVSTALLLHLENLTCLTVKRRFLMSGNITIAKWQDLDKNIHLHSLMEELENPLKVCVFHNIEPYSKDITVWF
jgi:hypothetical protein